MSKEGKIINIIEIKIRKYIDSIRPLVDKRDLIDIGYNFKSNTLEVFEIRPRCDNKEEKIHSLIAKTKFIKSRGIWVVYWRRASGKWERYEPNSEVNEISEFFEILKADKYGCFWG